MSNSEKKALEAYTGTIIFAEELDANNGKSHALEGLDPQKTVCDLRHNIARAIDNLPSWSLMQVIFAGEVMEDMTKKLADYGVHNGDTVYFVRSVTEAPPPYDGEPDALSRTIQSRNQRSSGAQISTASTRNSVPAPTSAASTLKTLFFKDLDGKSLVLSDVPIDARLSAVFRRLATEKAMDVEWLRFIWSGKQLNGDKTVRDYGIMNESTIHIVARLRGGQ